MVDQRRSLRVELEGQTITVPNYHEEPEHPLLFEHQQDEQQVSQMEVPRSSITENVAIDYGGPAGHTAAAAADNVAGLSAAVFQGER